MNRLEQRKNSIEKTLKDFNIPYKTKCDRRYFIIKYQNKTYKLEVSNKYIDIQKNISAYRSYGFFEGVLAFRNCIQNDWSLEE